ncbi:hypothetical protein CEXT_316801 [Caerostris extrusa]|uniref:Uncharacterized protein n=1 Tax=Caerostris extrusa TaxID=172846 RepID=A0AAV4WU70_CAEEX|nr:hypothetical protein CEXT_316801 [Caerostris extrusa]
MEIPKCEFCNAYITNFEVHNCFNLGNQHRQMYATIPQQSYANLARNSDLSTTQPMDYEGRWSSLSQINSSMQQSILPDICQRTGYERKAAAEMSPKYGFSNQNPYNPDTPDFLFPGIHHIQENEPNLTHLQLQSEENKKCIHQNSQKYESLNTEHPTNIPGL